MYKTNRAQLLVDTSNAVDGRAVFSFLCDFIDAGKEEECKFAEPSKKSRCQFTREDHCTGPRAKIDVLKRHITKANTALAALERAELSKVLEPLQAKENIVTDGQSQVKL